MGKDETPAGRKKQIGSCFILIGMKYLSPLVVFIGSAVSKRPIGKIVKATVPFYVCMLVALMLITFVPDISLWLPKVLGDYVPGA